MHIIATGFTEFGIVKDNSSKYALSNSHLNSNVLKKYLSVDLNKTKEELCQIINDKPDLLIMFGQSGKSDKIHIEKCARNILNFKIEDNGGNKPINSKIIDNGEYILNTKTDIVSLNKYLNDNDIPSEISIDAGEYICNYSYYLALNSEINAIFIHLPLYTNQSDNDLYHYMDKNVLIKAVELITNYLEELWLLKTQNILKQR